ncbi:hypothetical protein C1645_806984 [Glomus cerebriforme]|uniref:SWIM-type domain-containing protein n=1 Tax=Glomus cerebriforme TaxID=658196 RepID=A0A397SPN5_9GLOM|nr:hypothetical protein C1645_806984 [Glomus cerebriforme]
MPRKARTGTGGPGSSNTENQAVVRTSDDSQQNLTVTARPKRGRKPKIPTEQTTTQETTTIINQVATMEIGSSTSSAQQNLTVTARPRRGRKPKIPIEQTTTQETTTINQVATMEIGSSTSSAQQNLTVTARPRRGRKPKNTLLEQPVGTETEILEQVVPNEQPTEAKIINVDSHTSPNEQPQPSQPDVSQPKRGEKKKLQLLKLRMNLLMGLSPLMHLLLQHAPQPSQPDVSQPKRGRKKKIATAQITNEPTDGAITINASASSTRNTNEPTYGSVTTNASATSTRGQKRKVVTKDNTTTDQAASDDQNADEGVSEGNPPKRGRKNLLRTVQAESVEAPDTTTESATNSKKRKATTEDTADQEAGSAKENRKSKKPKKEEEEKRLARHRTICTAQIQDRIYRAEVQRIYMVSRTRVNELRQEFAILGSTGNVYTVTITHLPDCTCPDFKKGNLCKHIIFVYLRVLRLNRNSPFIYQKALLSKELRSIFANAAPDPTVLANKRVVDKYQTITSGETLPSASNIDEKRRPIEEDCPICYEPLEEKDRKNIVWCREGCGNNLHKDCFEQWKKSKRGCKVTCVYCRRDWMESTEPEALINEEGYVNLGGVQGMNTRRDTTSYYRAFRTGQYY